MKKLEEIVNNMEELENIFNYNDKLKEIVEKKYKEDVLLNLTEKMEYVENGVSGYNINYNSDNYINVSSPMRINFLEGCKKIQKDHEVFEDISKENFYTNLIDITIDKYNEFVSMDTYDKYYKSSDYYIDTNINIIKDRLLNYFNKQLEINEDNVLDYFVNVYIFNIDIDNYIYDENYILYKKYV